MNEGKPKIFISHSWEDNEIAKKLEENLRRDGAEIWIDYDKVKAGDSFIKRMNEGLEWCNTLILVWSKSATKSIWVEMEWQGALVDNIKIIPCLIDDKKLPRILKPLLYKDLSDFDEGYNGLAKDLNLVITEEKPKAVKKAIKTPPKKTVAKPEVIEPKITIFRSNPKKLSIDDLRTMLKKYGFFDSYYNEDGKGFNHQYEAKTIKGAKTIIDNASGLMWQQSGSSASMEFEETKNWIKEVNQKGFAGFNDWRLPTLEEAMSLVGAEKKELYIDPRFDSKQDWIWTGRTR